MLPRVADKLITRTVTAVHRLHLNLHSHRAGGAALALAEAAAVVEVK